MPRVPVHTIDDAPEAARDTLRRLERSTGRPLNIYAEMAHAPVVLAAYQGIRQAIAEHGSFSAKTREAIALAVSAVNGCAYCQSAHTAAARAVGWSLEDTVAIRAGTAGAVAASRFGQIVVQGGGITSAILSAVVAKKLPGRARCS